MSKVLFNVSLIFAASAVIAAENPTRTPYGKLHDEWKAEKQALTSALSVSSADNQAELERQSLDLQRRYTARFLELAKEHAADGSTWQDCLLWMSVEGAPGEDFDAMIDLMGAHAQELKGTTSLQLMLSNFVELPSERLNPVLRDLAENHSARGIRGAALFTLGARFKLQGEEAGYPEICIEAESVLEEVVKKYPDVRTYRGENQKNAERLLDELRGPLAIGRPAPETLGKDLEGSDFSLRELRGKVIVLSFSGHWCTPCRAMHPIERQLVRSHSPQEVELIEINSDQDPDVVAAKMVEDGLRWRIVLEGSTKGPISEAWQIRSWPTFYVLDRQHRIRRKASGYIGEKLIDWVKELVAEER